MNLRLDLNLVVFSSLRRIDKPAVKGLSLFFRGLLNSVIKIKNVDCKL